jgi:hypothetical protein
MGAPTTRWLDLNSDLSPELRRLVRAAATSQPGDAVRLRRIRARLLPLFGGALVASQAAAQQAAQVVGSIGSSTTAATAAPAAITAIGVKSVGALLLVAGVSATVPSDLGLHAQAIVHTQATQQADSHYRAALPRCPAYSNVRASASALVESSEALPQPEVPYVSEGVAPEQLKREMGTNRGPQTNQFNDDTADNQEPESIGSVADEARLLRHARSALAGSPEKALKLLRGHALLFPNSTLALERELFTIDALARCGRSGEAEQRLQSFRQLAPNSALVQCAERAVYGRSSWTHP